MVSRACTLESISQNQKWTLFLSIFPNPKKLSGHFSAFLQGLFLANILTNFELRERTNGMDGYLCTEIRTQKLGCSGSYFCVAS